MNKRTPIVLALASLALTSVACDADSPDEPPLLMAADVIDLEDAEALADDDERFEPLVEAVELTADAEPSAFVWQAVAEYCWGAGDGRFYDYYGQCIDAYEQLIPGWCIVLDPNHFAAGYALQCSTYY